MFEKVLLLAAGDDVQQPAARRALQCVADGGEIVVLTVAYEAMLEGYLGNKDIYEPLRRRVLEERREQAVALARALERAGVRASHHAVWSHPLHAAIAAEVEARGIDLVVAAPAGFHAGAPARGLSHADWQVVRRARAPLLVVKSDGGEPYRSIVAAVDPFHTHAKPADLDRRILAAAKALQHRTRATLAAVHCYVPIEYFGADLARIAPTEPGVADRRLEAVRALCIESGIPSNAARLTTGAPATVLVDMQRRGEADLVVMGALARNRLAELVLGNTAERVLHSGNGDVLVVTPAASSGAA